MPEDKVPQESHKTNIPDIEKDGIRKFLEYHFPHIEEEYLNAYEYLCLTFPDKLFPPYSKDEDLPIEEYTNIHSKIHKKQAVELVKEEWDVLVLESGMYGGKTSLSYEILDELRAMGYSIEIFISDVMGEDFVTARSYQDGDKERKAKRYGEKYRDIQLPENTDKRVVLLDEFSFLDIPSIKNFVQYCRENNVKVILTGLNRNHQGVELPVFKDLKGIIGEYVSQECLSFVPGRDTTQIPTGTHTARYINVGGREILDLGILPEVVSKEEKNRSGEYIERYIPAKEDMTAVCIFKNRPELIEPLLNPTAELKKSQNNRLELMLEI
jgi:hypothetical protein